jgi:hypothetical protein
MNTIDPTDFWIGLALALAAINLLADWLGMD